MLKVWTLPLRGVGSQGIFEAIHLDIVAIHSEGVFIKIVHGTSAANLKSTINSIIPR